MDVQLPVKLGLKVICWMFVNSMVVDNIRIA